MTECFINGLFLHGHVDTLSNCISTATIRPGEPSSMTAVLLSGIVREPMAELEYVILTRDRSLRNVICRPRVLAENCIRIVQAPNDCMPQHNRAVYIPGMIVTIQGMIDPVVEKLDTEAKRVLKSWMQDLEYSNAKRIGLIFDNSCKQIFQGYLDTLKNV